MTSNQDSQNNQEDKISTENLKEENSNGVQTKCLRNSS